MCEWTFACKCGHNQRHVGRDVSTNTQIPLYYSNNSNKQARALVFMLMVLVQKLILLLFGNMSAHKTCAVVGRPANMVHIEL